MKQTVKEAVKEAIHKHYNCNGAFPCSERGADEFAEGFIAGAEWQAKQSPWISVEERLPETNKEVLVLCRRKRSGVCFVIENAYENGDWVTKSAMYYETVAWMPIPSFDDILDANKDVLERIKNK